LKKGKDPVVLVRQGLMAAAVLVVISAFVSLFLLTTLASTSGAIRISVAIVLVSLPAFFMGWGFPLGMTIFTRKNAEGGAWFWAVNGATSVLGSVLAAIVSVTMGITATLVFGALLYLLAWVVTLLMVKSAPSQSA
jgi:hypothetical protein